MGRCRTLIFHMRKDNPLCGDQIRMDLLVEDDTIKEVRFCGHGCTISLAAASMLTEKIEGKSLDEVKQLTKGRHFRYGRYSSGPRSHQVCIIGTQSPQSRCLRHQLLARRGRIIPLKIPYTRKNLEGT